MSGPSARQRPAAPERTGPLRQSGDAASHPAETTPEAADPVNTGSTRTCGGAGLSTITAEPSVEETPSPPSETGTDDRGRGSTAGRRAAGFVARFAPIALPPLGYSALAWHRRWITDDGLIVARTVQQILAGNGPVFNAGERVEADTSALWTWLIAGLTWTTGANVYAVMMWAGLVLSPLGLLLALLGARRLHHRIAPGRQVFPLGALVVLALPPFWDFATSGLEDPLIFSWLGLTWWLMAGVGPDTTRRNRALAFVAGLGWVVRPDMAIGTACFLVALWYAARPSRRGAAALLGIAAAVPLGYEIFRMGYYGMLVPNTAIAKQASTFHVVDGLTYLDNFEAPYHLWIPALLLLLLAPALVGWRRLDRTGRACVAATAAAGVLMAAYVIAIGGDFMHARMLLPATFALLLPFMAVPLPTPGQVRLFIGRRAQGRRALPPFGRATAVTVCVALMATWTFVCAGWWRLPQPFETIPKDGITNERSFWVAVTDTANPTTATPYIKALLGPPAGPPHTVGWVVGQDAEFGPRTLLVVLPDGGNYYPFHLSRPGASVAITGDVLGTLGATVPLDGIAIDQHGLSWALASHLQPGPDGRVGHDEYAGPVWVVADYSNVRKAPEIPAAQLAAARRVLGCGAVGQLQQATQAPMGWGRFFDNLADAFKLTTLRIPDNPQTAEQEFCG
jgi:arabinofuranosyltransferase